jgi:hypothetical protein
MEGNQAVEKGGTKVGEVEMGSGKSREMVQIKVTTNQGGHCLVGGLKS